MPTRPLALTCTRQSRAKPRRGALGPALAAGCAWHGPHLGFRGPRRDHLLVSALTRML